MATAPPCTKRWEVTGDDNKPKFPTLLMVGLIVGVPMGITYKIGLGFYTYLFLQVLLAVPIFVFFVSGMSYLQQPSTAGDCTTVFNFADKALETMYKGKKIAFETMTEAYLDLKIEFKEDLYETLLTRNKWATFPITWGHITFLFKQFANDVLVHTQAQDKDQVMEHYDRGNDFYSCFLGDRMIYTSAIYKNEEETLEQAQDNKLKVVCDKIHLKKGDKMLDIGCGWGTLIRYAAKQGAKSTGVTLSKNQELWNSEKCKKEGISNNANVLRMDYRDIPMPTNYEDKYDKITCLEMAEHVGVKRFQAYCVQVRNMLKDDGIFYLKIAGLRRAWQYEDLNWGLFMNKYVFPGADASCPLTFNTFHLEKAGFEVRSVETVGVHYSKTLKHWYENWHKAEHKAIILKNYGERWFRQWSLFLAWSVVAAGEGKATCYQIVCHKNLNSFNRKIFVGEGPAGRP